MHPLATEIRFTLRHPVVRSGSIAALFALSVFVIAFIFVWYPSASRHHEIQQDISQLRNKLVTQSKLNGLSRSYFSTQKMLEKIERKLDSTTSLAEFTHALNRLASKNKIKIISKLSRDSQVQQNYKIQYQELVLQGEYKALRHFILGLRDMPVWTLIKEVRLKKKKGSDELIVDIVIASYQARENT